METFNVCWLAILKEANNAGVFFVKKAVNEFGTCSNFDLTVNRLEYLYKHGALIINLVAEGILSSSQKFPKVLKIYNELISKQNCKICSLSNGPGVEVVGFVYGFKKYVNAFKDVSVCVATKCKEWNALSETLINGKFHSTFIAAHHNITICTPSDFHFLPYEMTVLSSEVRESIQHCDVLLMYKSYEFVPDITVFKAILVEIFSLMKKDALLFFFDGRTRMKLFESLAGCGEILFGPQKVKVKDIPYDASFIQLVGVKPNHEGTVRFTLWKKTATSKKCNSEAIQNIYVQKQIPGTLDNTFEKVSSPYTFPIYNAGVTHELFKIFNSGKADFSEHVPESKLNTKPIKERSFENFLSNEESDSDKSKTMSEISISTNHSTKQKLLKRDSSTNTKIIKKESSSNCKESSKVSQLPSNQDSNHQGETTDKSTLNTMIEHCEKMVSDLEKKLEKLSTKVHSSENNLHENCYTHNGLFSCNFCCPSHLHIPCSVSHSQCCCNYSCHHFTSQEPVKCNCVRRTGVSSINNTSYLLIPLQNNVLLTDTVTKLLNRN